MNEKLYTSMVHYKFKSALAGEGAVVIHHSNVPDIPVLKEFLKDDDLQEITVVSTNLGFVKTIRKAYRR